jgi:type III secretion protein Q
VIDLPLCSPGAVRALAELSQRLPVEFSCGGVSAKASLLTGEAVPAPAEWHRLTARFRSHSVGLALDPAVLPSEARTRWPELAAPDLPEPLREILLDLALAELAQDVEVWCGERPNWHLDDAPFQPHRVVITAVDAPTGPIAIAELDDAALSWLAERCRELPKWPIEIEAVPWRLALVIDRIALTPNDLAALEVRDVVLLDRVPVASDGTVTAVLCAPGFAGFRVGITGSRATLESSADAMMDSSESPRRSSEASGPPATSSPNIDELPLVVECEIGQLTMPLARLRELAPGQVIDLGFDASRRVTLRLNGQPIAVGELVRIEDRTGVRINELHLNRAR